MSTRRYWYANTKRYRHNPIRRYGKKTKEGRLLINLTGITRFEIIKEINNKKSYREFEISYDKFIQDLSSGREQFEKKEKIKELSQKIKIFFKKNGLLLNWKEFEKLDQDQKINTLAMIAPISDVEKQSILESLDAESKTKILSEIIEFYLYENLAKIPTMQ